MTPRKARKARMARAFLRMAWPTCHADGQLIDDDEYWKACDFRLDVERAAWAFLQKHAPRSR